MAADISVNLYLVNIFTYIICLFLLDIPLLSFLGALTDLCNFLYVKHLFFLCKGTASGILQGHALLVGTNFKKYGKGFSNPYFLPYG